MGSQSLTGTIVGLAVAVILAATLLMPALNDATTTHETITNTGQYYMTGDAEYKLVYDPSDMSLTINDEDPISIIDNLSGGSWTIISSDTFLVRLQGYASQEYRLWLLTESTNRIIADRNNANPATVNCTDGAFIWDTENISFDTESFRGYYPTTSDYIMTNGTDLPTLNGDSSIIIGNGTTQVTAWTDRFYITGTIEDGATVEAYEGITVSDVAVNATAIDKYKDGYTFTSVTFTATDGEHTTNATYNRVIVPTEVTVELSQRLSDGENAILSMLPIIVIAGIVVGAVALVAGGRRD